MLFNKTSLCSKVPFVGHGFFLFETDDDYKVTKQIFVFKDLDMNYSKFINYTDLAIQWFQNFLLKESISTTMTLNLCGILV